MYDDKSDEHLQQGSTNTPQPLHDLIEIEQHVSEPLIISSKNAKPPEEKDQLLKKPLGMSLSY